uniref:Uncharacterized protein n=1 Tax=Timema cristinae TaxID=61476 RepID=A0A7R9CDR6_TIMCR|nr:unnamed protein product [Timema cristinae]
MWRSNPALAGALLLLLLLLSPAAEAKRVPRRRPRPQAQQPEAPGAGTDDFNYEEGYDEYPDYYEELEFVGANTVKFKSAYAQQTGNLLRKGSEKSCKENNLSTPERDSNPDLPIISSLVYCESDALDQVATEAGKTSTSTSTTTTTTTTTPPPPPPPIEVQPIGQVAPVDVPETTLPPEPVEPSPQPPSRAVSPPQPASRVEPDRKEALEKLKLSLLEQCGIRWPSGLILIGLELSRDQISALFGFDRGHVNPEATVRDYRAASSAVRARGNTTV